MTVVSGTYCSITDDSDTIATAGQEAVDIFSPSIHSLISKIAFAWLSIVKLIGQAMWSTSKTLACKEDTWKQVEGPISSGIWKSRKWKYNGNWKQKWKLETEMETGNRNGNATSPGAFPASTFCFVSLIPRPLPPLVFSVFTYYLANTGGQLNTGNEGIAHMHL